jgi:hypothetical protein
VKVIIRHWLPIITYCPVNSLPDFIYVSVHVNLDSAGQMLELYAVRRTVRRLVRGSKAFMEDIALHVQDHLLSEMGVRASVEVRLAFNRHVVYVE